MTIEEDRIESQDYLFMECLRDKKCKRHVNMKTGKDIFGEKHWRAKDEVVNAFDLDEIAFLTGLHKDLVQSSGAKLVSMGFTNTLEWLDKANNDHTFLWYLSDKGKQYLQGNEVTSSNKYTSDNLFVDEILNFEYVVNPDKDDDLDLYEYAKELKKTKFKQVLIPFKFNMGHEEDIDDYFVFSKEYDDENQINFHPHKKHYLYLTNLEKDYALMVWKFHLGENYKIGAYEELIKSTKFDLTIETMKLRKDNQPFDYRYIGIVSMNYEIEKNLSRDFETAEGRKKFLEDIKKEGPSPFGGAKQVHLGYIRGLSCETLWTHFDKFLLNESTLDKDMKDAYDKDLSKVDYEVEYMKRHDCVFPF